MVRFLLLTAQRRDEAASLRYGHILDGVWRQAENKSIRPHSLTLPPLALTLVGHGEARDYVFAGRVGKMSASRKLKAPARRGVRRHRLATARFEPYRGHQHAGAWNSQ